MSDKDELDTLLNRWQDVPEADPQLTHHVWTRIAAEAAEDEHPVLNWFQQGLNFLSSPLGATAFVAASIVLGIFLAELRVSQTQSSRAQDLAQNYIQLIEARTATFSQEQSQ